MDSFITSSKKHLIVELLHNIRGDLMSTDVKGVNGTIVICVFWLHWVFTLVVVRSNFVYGEEPAYIQYTVHNFKLNIRSQLIY